MGLWLVDRRVRCVRHSPESVCIIWKSAFSEWETVERQTRSRVSISVSLAEPDAAFSCAGVWVETLTFSDFTAPYLALILGSLMVARLVPVMVNMVPPLTKSKTSWRENQDKNNYMTSQTACHTLAFLSCTSSPVVSQTTRSPTFVLTGINVPL